MTGPGRRPRRPTHRGRPLDEQLLRQLSTDVRATRLMLATLVEQMSRQGQPLVPVPELRVEGTPDPAAPATDQPVPVPPPRPLPGPLAVTLPAQPTSDLIERRAAAYARLVERLHAAVVRVVPAGEQVLVVSRGDEALLDLPGRPGWHFPRTEEGLWAGHHPADSAAAISHLEQLRSAGAQHLVVPATSAWWLSHYAGFRAHLERTGRLLLRDDVGVVYALDPPPVEAALQAAGSSRAAPARRNRKDTK